MLQYNQNPVKTINLNGGEIASFLSDNDTNIDKTTVVSFGNEWKKFNKFEDVEIEHIGSQYFDIVDDAIINKNSLVLDVGCGSGRWTKYVAGKVKYVEAIDPSESVFFAQKLNAQYENVRITQASVDNIPFDNNVFDFVFSLGVLHHIPNTKQAMQKCVDMLKPNGFFLVYLYYKLDNRGFFYRLLFLVSDIFRRIISSLPYRLKHIICDIISVTIYMPFVLLSRLFRGMIKGDFYKKIPLSYYADKKFFVIRNDALDRFGTPLEQRFSKNEIREMMHQCGLSDIKFSEKEPFWHAIGKK